MAETGPATYDGFLSYSHAADDLLAPRLQAGLQRFAKPWWKRRALRVFRDEASLSANPHLWSSITDALDDSDWFVLLLSPDAAGSEWVNREIDYWVENKDSQRILPVVTDGTFGWADGDVAGDAVPASLRGVFGDEPRWVDLRFARSETQLDLRHTKFRDAVADIAAAVRGVAKDELESEEIRQHRRTIRTAWTGGIAILALGIAATVGAIVAFNAQQQAEDNAALAEQNAALAEEQRDEAQAQRNEAETARRGALALALARSSTIELEGDQELALLLAIEAVEVTRQADGTVLREAEEALHNALQSFRLVRTLPGGSDAAVTLDGDVAIAAGGVSIWSIYTGDELATLSTETEILSADVSPDGRSVAVGGSDGVVEIWEIDSNVRTTVQDPTEEQGRPITDIRFSPDGSLLVWGDRDGFWSAYDVASLAPAQLPGTGFSLRFGAGVIDVRVAFSPDGKRVALAGDVGMLWNRETGEAEPISHEEGITGLAFADGGETLVMIGRDGRAVVWGILPELREEASIDLGGDSTPSAFASFRGETMAVGFENGAVRVFRREPAALTELFSLGGHRQTVRSLSFTSDGTRLISTSGDATRVWDVTAIGQREWFTVPATDALGADLAFSPDGSMLAVAQDDGFIGVFDGSSGEELRRFEPSPHWFGFAGSIAFLPEGDRIAVSFIDPRQYPVGLMRIFDLDTGEEQLKLRGSWQVGLTTSHDGTLVASAGPGGVTLYDAATGDSIDAVLGTGEGDARQVAFNPDGTLLAFQDETGHIDVYEFDTLTQLAAMEHPMPVDLGLGSLEFAPDGNQMVTAGGDGTAKLWDPVTGAELAVMSGHSGPVTAARFSPEGALIATGGTDGTVRLWDTATGTEELTVRNGGPSISSLAFTTGGRLAVLTASHTAEVYAIDIADLLSLARARIARALTDEECRLYLQQDACPEEKP